MELANLLSSLCVFTLIMTCTILGCGVQERALSEYIVAGQKISESTGEQTPTSVELPSDSAGLTFNGEAILKKFGPNQIGVLFVRSRGKGSNFEGFIFFSNSTAINELPIKTNAYGNKTINVSPFLIDGEQREVDAEFEPTHEASLFRISFRLD